MKFKFAFVFIVAVIVLAWFSYRESLPPFEKFEVVPDFVLPTFDQKIVRLGDFRGTPVLLHFWATWCGQCTGEIPLLDQFARNHSDIHVVAVSEDEAGEAAVKSFFRNGTPAFTVVFDADGSVADKYKNYKVPETYLLDENGRFVERFIGAVSWENEDVYRTVKSKLSTP